MKRIPIAAFECAIGIECDPELEPELDRYFLPSLTREPATDAAIRYRVVRDGAVVRFLDAAGTVATADSVRSLVPAIHRTIDQTLVAQGGGRVAIHAGAVAVGGRAVLIVGSSRSGKTTLVAELLKAGSEYLSDEYAVVDGDGRVHAYPRALMMRNEADDQIPVPAWELGAAAASAPREAGLILALSYLPGGSWAVEPAHKSAMLVQLLKSTPRTMDTPEIVDPLARAVSLAACYSGARGDAAEAAARIIELAQSRS